jgi:hypothetical protein
VNALSIGQWQQIPNTSISSVEPSPIPLGTNRDSKVIAWTSFVVDTRTSKVYSVANGGHNNYAGNEVDVLDLERDQPVWSQILPPTPNSQITNGQSYYADGRPTSRHTYYGVTLDEFNDRIMLFSGAIWCDTGCGHAAISSYNIGINAYSPSTTHGSVSSQFGGSSGTFAANPLTGDVYALADSSTGKWTRSSNTFANLSPIGTPPHGGFYSMSAFDTSRGRILFLGGSSSNRHTYTLSSNTFAQVTLTGPNANVSSADQGALVYVPAIDSYLLRIRDAGGTVYQVNAATFEATTFPTTGGASIPLTENGPFNKFLYVPRLRGAVYVPVYDGGVWFLRVH